MLLRSILDTGVDNFVSKRWHIKNQNEKAFNRVTFAWLRTHKTCSLHASRGQFPITSILELTTSQCTPKNFFFDNERQPSESIN